MRKKSKLVTPKTVRDTETLVSSIPSSYEEEDIRIKREPELKGAFKALRDKGVRFTSYEEYNS